MAGWFVDLLVDNGNHQPFSVISSVNHPLWLSTIRYMHVYIYIYIYMSGYRLESGTVPNCPGTHWNPQNERKIPICPWQNLEFESVLRQFDIPNHPGTDWNSKLFQCSRKLQGVWRETYTGPLIQRGFAIS